MRLEGPMSLRWLCPKLNEGLVPKPRVTRADSAVDAIHEVEESYSSLTSAVGLSKKLEELPPDIGSCYSLRTLNVSGNRLKTIPDELAQLVHLESFLAYSNQITSVPEWLSTLDLTELNMFNNKILKLPAVLGELKLVTEMNFAANVIMQVIGPIGDSFIRVPEDHICIHSRAQRTFVF